MRTPAAVAVDSAGNIFIADSASNVVVKYTPANGQLAIAAGTGSAGYSGDGQRATSAALNAPSAVAVDAAGNLYIADSGNNVIRFVDASTQTISTFAGGGSNYGADGIGDGGPARNASLNAPAGLILDRSGALYISDTGNNVVRKVDTSNIISVVAGSAPGTTPAAGSDGLGDGGKAVSAALSKPAGLALDASGAHLYIADRNNNLIRVVDLATGLISIAAGAPGMPPGFTGDGTRATSAALNAPKSVALDAAGNLYIADSGNHAVRRVDAVTGIMNVFTGLKTGSGFTPSGLANAAALNAPVGIALDSTGDVYVADAGNSAVQLIATSGQSFAFPSTVVGQVSSAQSITVANIGSTDVTLSAITVTAGFIQQPSSTGNDCAVPMTLHSGATCQISFTFAPGAIGAANGTLTVASNWNNMQVLEAVQLSGTAVALSPAGTLQASASTQSGGTTTSPGIGPLSASNIDFGTQPQWTSSASQMVAFTNPAAGVDAITSVRMLGANSGDFNQTNTCGSSVAAGASCSITVTFTPSTRGPETASLVLTSADSGSPYTIALTGSGTAGTTWPFGFVRALSVAHTQVPNSDLTNFPVLVSGTFPWLAAAANGGRVQSSSGNDIVFTADSGGTQKLNWEVEKYDPTTGQFVAWVLLPTVSHVSDTPFYIWYGNSAITVDQSNQQGTWASEFSGVWHLTDATPLLAMDSTSNMSNGVNNSAAASPAVIANGDAFDGASSFIQAADASVLDLDTTDSFTFEFWMKSTQTSPGIILEKLDSAFQNGYQVALVNGSLDYFMSSNYGANNYLSVHSSLSVVDGKWHHMVLTYDGTASTNGIHMYIDGNANPFVVSRNTLSASIANSVPLDFGRRRSSNNLYLSGGLDEIRIAKDIVRSADWVRADYNNQSSPATFVNVGAETVPSQISVTPTAAAFGNQIVGTASAPTALVVSNAFGLPSVIGAISISGANAADFSQSSDCASYLPAGATCTISVAFTASAVADESASLVIAGPQATSALAVPLSGTGYIPTPAGAVSTNTVAFGNQAQWTSAIQTLMFSNPGTGANTVQSVRISGANASDFRQVNTCAQPVAPGGSCSIAVTFTPSTAGAESATLAITAADAGSPYVVGLSGTGTGGAWAFAFQRTLTVLHTQVSNSDQTNFPVLVSGTFPWLASMAYGGGVQNSGGYDIVFTADAQGNTKLNWEVEKYDPTSGQFIAWVLLPSVSHSTDTPFYMWYGNPAISADQSSPQGVWDSSFSGVWHLPNGIALSGADSTANGSTVVNNGARAALGPIGGDATFNGSTAYLETPEAPQLDLDRTDSFTFEFWTNTAQKTNGIMLEKLSAGISGYQVALVNGYLDYFLCHDYPTNNYLSVHSSFAINDGKWHHVVLTYGGTSNTNGIAMYIDGARHSFVISKNSLTASFANSNSLDFGRRRYSNNLYFTGSLDEIRISKGLARSADWIRTEYNNQKSPAGFVVIGDAVAAPQAVLNPASLSFGTQTVATTSTAQAVTLSNPGGVPLSISSISAAGPNASDFIEADNCGGSLAPGMSCTISVSFAPSIVGAESASLAVVDSAAGSPHTIALAGNGQNPVTAGLLVNSGALAINASSTFAQNNGTVTFTSNRPVSWSLAPGSSGTLTAVNSTHAVYVAPASIQNQNVLAGCPVLPNDSIFNIRIDNLPVHPSSANWTSTTSTGTNGVSFDTSWGTSIGDNNTPLTNELFYYTSQYNGPWMLPALPQLKRENGAYVTDQNSSDHHVLAVNRDTCRFWEIYNNYMAPRVVSGKTYTATSGYSYDALSYGLPTNGSTDAAGLPLGPLTLHLDEVEAGAVRHALRFTLAGGYIYGNSKFIYWPATQPHYAGCCTNSPPYGARFRLKASFDISGFSPMAQVILTGLKQYGMILADAGTGPTVSVDTDFSRDPAAMSALGQIGGAHITLANFEAVDESSLMLSANSSRVNPNNPYVQPATFAVVNAADQSNSGNLASYPVALQGVHIGLTEPALYIAAGSYSYQVSWWMTGTANQSVTWSLVSGPGSITPDGLYTPPPAVTNSTRVVLQAVSAADSTAVAFEYVYVVPMGADGAIRINSGGLKVTDKLGNVWLSDQGFEAGDYRQVKGDYPGWPAQSNPEITVYQSAANTYGSDVEYRFVVPNGNYKVRFMFGQLYDGHPATGCTFPTTMHAPMMVDAQGQTAAHNYDFGKIVNYVCAVPVDLYVPAQVTDNTLRAAIRVVQPDGQQGTTAPEINGFEIIPDSSAPYLAIDTQQQTSVNPGSSLQLYAVGWYMSNAVTWSVSGPGVISPAGLYTAPADAPASPETVTITATSTVDPSITATATITVP